MHFSLAEALTRGTLGKDAYSPASLNNSDILTLARKIHCHVDPGYPGSGQFKGAVKITMNDGCAYEEIEEFNRGSVENPMTYEELLAKFDANAAGLLPLQTRASLADQIAMLETMPDASEVLRLAPVLG